MVKIQMARFRNEGDRRPVICRVNDNQADGKCVWFPKTSGEIVEAVRICFRSGDGCYVNREFFGKYASNRFEATKYAMKSLGLIS
jgi:hypothetical protein